MCHVNHRMEKKRTIFRMLHERDEGLMDNVCLYYRLNTRAKGFVGGSYMTRKASSGALQKSVFCFSICSACLILSSGYRKKLQKVSSALRGCTVHVPL